jgi:hypothetical protein
MTNPPDEWAGLIEKLEAAALADASKHLGFAGSGVVAVLQEDLSRLIAAVRSGKDEGSRAQERVPTEPVEAAVVGDQERSNAIGVGMVIAAAIIADHNPVYAAEILGAAGLETIAEMRVAGCDAYDVNQLRHVIRDIARHKQPRSEPDQ